MGSRATKLQALARKQIGPTYTSVRFYGADPKRNCPSTPSLAFGNVNDFSITPDQIIDRIDYDLSCMEFHGDAYPWVNMSHFGPGVVAAFLGAKLENNENTVWFHPQKVLPIEDLHFEFDDNNVWFNRIRDIYIAAMKRWKGDVVMAMTDLGGILDILATFRGTDNLLMDLYDSPEDVARLVGEVQNLWLKCYDAFNEVLKGSRGIFRLGHDFVGRAVVYDSERLFLYDQSGIL